MKALQILNGIVHNGTTPCVKWSLTRGWKKWKIIEQSGKKVVVVAYL